MSAALLELDEDSFSGDGLTWDSVSRSSPDAGENDLQFSSEALLSLEQAFHIEFDLDTDPS